MVCAWWDGVRGAYVVRGGPYWWLWAILVEVVVVIRAITMYLRAEKDTDEGALAGSRADERQQLIAQRSWALAGKLTAIAAFVGLTIAIAVRATWWWPFLAILGVTGFGCLLGLSNYRVAEEDPADDANAGHQAQSPLNC